MILVDFSETKSPRHNLHTYVTIGVAIDWADGVTTVAILSLDPTATNPPCERFNEYLEPFAAKDKRLEHREHVDELCRKRFCGLIGSKLDDDRVSASTVWHFFKPEWWASGLDLVWCKLMQLSLRRRSGTTLHSFCCTEFSDVVDVVNLSLLIKLCSDGLRVIRISGDGINGGVVGSRDTFRPTKVLINCSKRLHF